jgi:hypothetical protein
MPCVPGNETSPEKQKFSAPCMGWDDLKRSDTVWAFMIGSY